MNFFCLLLLSLSITLCKSLPLSTNSRWIIDVPTGARIKLACVNWAGHLEPMIPEGLDKKPVAQIVAQIKHMGFNCVRLTYATYMYTRYSHIRVEESLRDLGLREALEGMTRNNPGFVHLTVVDAQRAVVEALVRKGVMIVLDNHVSKPMWCCGNKDGNGFFGDKYFDAQEWIQGLHFAAWRYKDTPQVVAMSLRNELRGNRQNDADWYKYMQLGADTIHKANPDLLVIISGLSFDTNLGFLKSKPLPSNLDNKLVYEAHWYAFGTPATEWAAKSNQLCGLATKRAHDNYLFVTSGNNSVPLFLSEFGINNKGDNEADNRYITCLMATAAEVDFDWALWTLQGSYMLRQGTVNLDELYGVVDLDWKQPRNPAFLERLYLLKQINQDFKSSKPMYYLMYHPQSGQCVQITQNGIVLTHCKTATWFDQHQDGGPIKLTGSPRCLRVAGDGAVARVSKDCSNKWKSVSSSGLHIAAQDGNGKYLCLEKNGSNSKLVTKKCLCVGDDLADFPTCGDNPQVQWFKFVPANV